MKNSKVDQGTDAEVDKLTNGRTGDGETDRYSDGSREGTLRDGRIQRRLDGWIKRWMEAFFLIKRV